MPVTGPALDKYFDFRVSSGGDIATQSGVAVLEKDLSLLIASVLDEQSFGQVITANDQLVLESQIQTELLDHGSVENVIDVTIQFGASNDLVEASATVTAAGDVVTPSVTTT